MAKLKSTSVLAEKYAFATPEKSSLSRRLYARKTSAKKLARKRNALIKKSEPCSPPTPRPVLTQKPLNLLYHFMESDLSDPEEPTITITANVIKIEPQEELEKTLEMKALDQYIEQETEWEQEMFLRGEMMEDYFFFNPLLDPRIVPVVPHSLRVKVE